MCVCELKTCFPKVFVRFVFCFFFLLFLLLYAFILLFVWDSWLMVTPPASLVSYF